MKTSVLRASSILLVAGVGAAVGYWAGRISTPATAPRSVEAVSSTSPMARQLSTADSQPARETPEPRPFRWNQLESKDFKVYIANLRAIGCPEQTIRDIIRSELDHVYAARHEALESPPPQQQHYWETRRELGPRYDYERRRQHRELEREKEALMAELLGPPGGGESAGGEVAFSPNAAGNDPSRLSPEVEEQVHDIQEKYMHLREDVFYRNDGRIYPDDVAVLQDLQDQRVAELSQVLSPEQLKEFELRDGPLADRLRHELAAFQPTEEEFRAIHEVREAFAGQYGGDEFDFDDPAYHRAREQVEAQMNEQLEQVLGPERLAEYQTSRDPRFRDLYALADRFELPQASVNEMYDLWRISEKQVDQLHANPSFDPAQKEQMLHAMRTELETEAQQLLGETAYANYRARGGEWMSHLFGEEPP